MFSQVCVNNSVHVCQEFCPVHAEIHTPLGRHTLWADTRGQTPPGQTPPLFTFEENVHHRSLPALKMFGQKAKSSQKGDSNEPPMMSMINKLTDWPPNYP